MALHLYWLLLVSITLQRAQVAAKAKGKDAKASQEGWTNTVNEEGRNVQQLKIEAPSMTEEDQYGYTMPQRYKCDSCRAVMFHLDKDLKKKHPKSRRMKQWEYTDAFDDACRTSFEGYGIKLLNGENTLSGPGLSHAESLAPGSGAIQMGGETWTKRLSEACRAIVYERVGEDELYEKYREDAGLSESICYQDLRDCTTGPISPPKPKEDTAKAKAEKPKAKKERKEKPKVPKETKTSQPSKSATAADATKAVPEASRHGSEIRVDSQTFLRRLAERHGLTSDEYLTSRTERDWEKLIVAMAGRIFNTAHTEL